LRKFAEVCGRAKMRRMRSVLVAAWIGSTNLGDELVFASLVDKLHARSVEVIALSSHPNVTVRDHQVRAVASYDLRAPIHADVTVFGGGGLLQNRTSAFNLPYHLARPAMARLGRRSVAAIGVGAGPINGHVAPWLVRHGLAEVRPFTVRDEFSRRQLERFGVEARTTADLAFGLDPPSRVETDRVVACLRPWSSDRRLLPVGARHPATDEWFVGSAARALDEVAGRLELPVHFVALQRDRDHPLHEQVGRRMRAAVSFATPTVHDVLDEVAHGAVVVSARYHGIVAAALAGRPSVAIGYDPKVEALAHDLGSSTRVVPWSPDGVASVPDLACEVTARADDALEGRERMRARERGNDDALDELLSR